MSVAKASFVIAYIIVLIGIGIWSARRTRSASDFFLGSRTIGPWVSAFAYGTTYFSAVLFVGYAGRFGWQYGFNDLWIVAGNVIVGTMLAWVLLAKRTRRMTVKMNALTMPEFLSARYGSKWMKYAAAAIIFIFLIPYTASIYQGLSYLFTNVLEINYNTALVSMAILTGIYLVLGGYVAVTLTDFVQGIIMVVGAVLLVLFITGKAGDLVGGGLPEIVDAVNANVVANTLHGPPAWLGLLSLVVLTSVGPLGLPQMVQKFYSIKGEEHIKKATVVATVFAFICAFAAYFSGAVTRAIFTAEEVKAIPGGLDNLMPVMIQDYLPTILTIVVMMLILSASMSTLSSLVLVSSSAVTIDMAGGDEKLGPRRATFMMRVLCAVFVAVSLLLALKEWTFIVNMMSLSWGAVAGAFLAPYVYGLFWKKATRAGAWAAMATGLTCAVFLPIILSSWWSGKMGIAFTLKSPWVPFAASVSILAPLLVLPVVSRFTRKPSEEDLQKIFD